ncbi:hypothetical protein PHLCEN_2v7872 [Hermanssonia centrifuga]|uniref:Uncharacterized protein n=1 Tax=Hermanssonia centrifuga TaxID=98765 RepID=A0A2R6NV84_9APHY|nr:hypothetical protein PHLCEN_2v7872 [Hermanssonia centrifuga]
MRKGPSFPHLISFWKHQQLITTGVGRDIRSPSPNLRDTREPRRVYESTNRQSDLQDDVDELYCCDK